MITENRYDIQNVSVFLLKKKVPEVAPTWKGGIKMALKRLTECELQVMKVIWRNEGEMNLQEILKEVTLKYGKDWRPQTVSTFLARLVKKGYLNVYRSGRTFLYTPIVEENVCFQNYVLLSLIHI